MAAARAGIEEEEREEGSGGDVWRNIWGTVRSPRNRYALLDVLTAGIERELLVIHAFSVSQTWESINRPSTRVDRLTLCRAPPLCSSSKNCKKNRKDRVFRTLGFSDTLFHALP